MKNKIAFFVILALLFSFKTANAQNYIWYDNGYYFEITDPDRLANDEIHYSLYDDYFVDSITLYSDNGIVSTSTFGHPYDLWDVYIYEYSFFVVCETHYCEPLTAIGVRTILEKVYLPIASK